MVDAVTLKWASSPSEYKVTPMRMENGVIAPHYQDEISRYGFTFDDLMKDAKFARVIDCELIAESIADEPLDHLARLAPSQRVRDLFLHWLAFVNGDLDPWTTGGAIHFRPHWARVLMLALSLGDRRNLPDCDMSALAAAAVFHDSRRANPYLDTGHGARAAAYYLQFCREAQSPSLRTPAGKSIVFDPRVYLTIYWHDRDDEMGLSEIARCTDQNAIPEAGIEDLREFLPEGCEASFEDLLRMFKDADALDRVRLGENGLDTRFLRSRESHEFISFAERLLSQSNRD